MLQKKRAQFLKSMSTHGPSTYYADERELRLFQERTLIVQKNLCHALIEFNDLAEEVKSYNDRIHWCVQKEVDTVRSLPSSLLRHVTPSKIESAPARRGQKRLASGNSRPPLDLKKKKEGEDSATKGQKKVHKRPFTGPNRKLSKEEKTKGKPRLIKRKSLTACAPEVHSSGSAYLTTISAKAVTEDGIHSLFNSDIEGGRLPTSKGKGVSVSSDGDCSLPSTKGSGTSTPRKLASSHKNKTASDKSKASPSRILGHKKRSEGHKYNIIVVPNCLKKEPTSPSKWKSMHQTTSHGLASMGKTSSSSRVVSSLSKIKPVGEGVSTADATKLLTEAFKKRDIQLFTVLDTSVTPPLPRYVAKIVPESTAMLPLNNVGSPPNSAHSGSTHIVVGTTSLARSSSTHTSQLSSHSVTNSTHPVFAKTTPSRTQSNPTHSSPTHPVPPPASSSSTQFVPAIVRSTHSTTVRLNSTHLASSSTQASSAHSCTHVISSPISSTHLVVPTSRSTTVSNKIHPDTVKQLTSKFSAEKQPITSASNILPRKTVHKIRVHGKASSQWVPCNDSQSVCGPSLDTSVVVGGDSRESSFEKTNRSVHTTISQLAPQNVCDKGVPDYKEKTKPASLGVTSVGKDRVLRSSLPKVNKPIPQYIRLDFKLPTKPGCSPYVAPWRNVARKSTGGSRHSRRRRIALKRMQLKVTKSSTQGLKMLKRKLKPDVKPDTQPECTSVQQSPSSTGTLDRYKYRNFELFRDHIRSRLKLPTSDEYKMLAAEVSPPIARPGEGIPESCGTGEVCARMLPFVGNCARTKVFKPEIFKPKKRMRVSRDRGSPCSSISVGDSHPCSSQSQSEDEHFPLVTLSPVAQRHPPNNREHESPNTRILPQLLDRKVNAISVLTASQEAIPKKLEEKLFETSSPPSPPQPMDTCPAPTLPEDSAEKDVVKEPVNNSVKEDVVKDQVDNSVKKDIVREPGNNSVENVEPVKATSLECKKVNDVTIANTGADVLSLDQSPERGSGDVTSPTDDYTLRLIQTIAKLSGEGDGQRSRK